MAELILGLAILIVAAIVGAPMALSMLLFAAAFVMMPFYMVGDYVRARRRPRR